MHAKIIKFFLICLIFSAVSPVAHAEEVWRHLDANGNVLNRIICTADVCGDPNSTYSRLTLKPGERYVLESAPTPTPTPTPTRTASPVETATVSPAPSPSPTPTSSSSDTRTITPAPSPTPTSSSSDTRTVSPSPVSSPTSKQSGLGGYAVVHPSGRVCGVIVATSSDPFGNGGVMPIEYMGCPVGSRIVFQTNPSPTGNVAGWHGENVTYNGSEFVIKNSASDSATVQTVVQGGVATDSNGRVWDTGSGVTIKPGVVAITDTKTVTTDTKTVTTDTRTVASTSTAPLPLAVKITVPDSSTVVQLIKSLSPKIVEAQLVANASSNYQSTIQINTELNNSLLQISASKKGSKTLSLNVQTNSKGDAKLILKTNLSGYTISLSAGSIKLDTDKIK